MAEMKVMFLGRASGKSTLLARKMYGVFIDASFPTFEELFRLSVNVRGTSVELYVYDIDGSDNFSEATRRYIAETAASVFVFSIADRWTFEKMSFYSDKIPRDGSKVLFLVGNMADREDERTVSREEAEEFARTHGMQYIETSAKTNQNIDELFELIVLESRKREALNCRPPVDKAKGDHQGAGKGLCTVF